jgi:hypothetical protein
LAVPNPWVVTVSDIIGVSPITIAEVEVMIIRTKGEVASIMVELRMVNAEDFPA